MEVVDCSIYVISKNWDIRRIHFPVVSIAETSKGRNISVYNIDKISDLKLKYYLATGKDANFIHLRGIPVKFETWIKGIREVGKGTSGKDRITMIPRRIVSWIQTGAIYLGWNLPTIDNTWPSISYRDRTLIPDLPQHAALRRDVTRISDIPTDHQSTQFEQLQADFSDIFISDLSPIYQFVVVELDEYIKPGSPLALSIANDENKLMRVYNGFIRKYFPMASESLFIDYLRARTATRDLEFQIGYAEVELDVIDKLIDAQKLPQPASLELAVISALITTASAPGQSVLLLRNLFDKVHIGTIGIKPAANGGNVIHGIAPDNDNNAIVQRAQSLQQLIQQRDGGEPRVLTGRDSDLGIHKIHMALYITPNYIGTMPVIPKRGTGGMGTSKQYVIVKRRANTNEYRVPQEFRSSGVTFIKAPTIRSVRARPSYLHMLETGAWRYRILWNLEDHIKIEDIITIARTQTSKIIDHFNTLLPYYGKEEILQVSKTNSRVSMLDATYIWNVQITEPEFKEVLRDEFRHFIEAKMASHRDAVHLEVLWTKGMLSPCIVKVVHGNTNVRIEIRDAEARGLQNLIHILEVFIAIVNNRIRSARRQRHERTVRGLPDTGESAEDRSKRIIKKLREQDPRLYDELKQNNVYSRKCQGYRQPIILTPAEYDALSASDKKSVIKYRNFTQGKVAHYLCQKDPDSNQRLVFSFITGIHERGWCVPCCKKKESKRDIETNTRARRDKECMQTGEYHFKGEALGVQTYVIVHSKPIKPDRLGYLPPAIHDIIGDGYYCFGVPQAFPATSRAGIVYAISHALGIGIEEYIRNIIVYIKQLSTDTRERVLSLDMRDAINFGSLSFGGSIGKSQSASTTLSPRVTRGGIGQTRALGILADVLAAIFIDRVEFYDWDEDWGELFAQLTLEIYDHNVVIFRPHNDTVRIQQNASPKILIAEYMFNDLPTYYPIYNINRRDFIRNGSINTRIFSTFKQLDAIIPIPKVNSLSHLMSIPGVKIFKQFLNRANRCYAVLASYSKVHGGDIPDDIEGGFKVAPLGSNLLQATGVTPVPANSANSPGETIRTMENVSTYVPHTITQDSPVAYIPVIASPLISRVPVQYTPFTAAEYTNLSLDISLGISSHMFGEKSTTLWYKDECIGYVHGGLNCYITPISNIDALPAELAKLPRTELQVDIEDVNRAIYDNRKPPRQLYEQMFQAYYNNYFYKILKIELLHIIDHSPLDSEGHPLYTLETLRVMSPAQLAAIIPHERRDIGMLSSNIIIPCAMRERSSHCADDKKLIVPANFEEFLEILIFELNDPIRDFIHEAERSFVINILDFVHEPGEYVNIYPVK